MRDRLRQLWPVLKVLLTLAIFAGVGWQFARILQDPDLQWVWLRQARGQWLAVSGLLYLLGLGFWASFWILLLRVLGERPKLPAAIRAYYIGHLGKYVPGKAWALILRTTLVQGPGVRLGVAALTATYETLTTMATGALLAVILFTLVAVDQTGMGWKAIGLLALAGIPILPGVFNWLVRRLSAPFQQAGAPLLPRLRSTTLLRGIALTGCGWCLLGAGLWATLQALLPQPQSWEWTAWGRYTAFIGLAYVAGYLTLPAPGGLGVRELILQQLLTPEISPLLEPGQAEPFAVVAVLFLRLLWTVAEVVIASIVYWFPGQGKSTKEQETSGP